MRIMERKADWLDDLRELWHTDRGVLIFVVAIFVIMGGYVLYKLAAAAGLVR